MHCLPDCEIPLELDVCVGSRKRLWSRDGIDDAIVEHFDDALAAPEILGKGGGRSRCVGSDPHFATGGSTSRCLLSRARRWALLMRTLLSRERLRRIEPLLRLLRSSTEVEG